MTIRLKDIAEKVGVRASTVSDILNERSTCYVSAELKDRVLLVARELNYLPNFIAKSLRRKNTATIGLIMAHFGEEVNTAKIKDIENLAWESGFHVYIGHTEGDAKREEAYIDDFLSRQVDGLIFVHPTSLEDGRCIRELIKKNFPLVIISTGQEEDVNYVAVDRRYGAYLAVEHLLKLGHRDIVFLCTNFPDHPFVKQRIAGYKDALAKFGVDFNEKLIYYDAFDYATGYERANDVLNERNIPTAIFAANDEVAIGAMRRLQNEGLNVPEDVSIVGFDDIKGAEFSHPPLTTVRQPTGEVGKKALEILLEKIKNPQSCELEQVIFKPELIVRKSTAKAKTFAQ